MSVVRLGGTDQDVRRTGGLGGVAGGGGGGEFAAGELFDELSDGSFGFVPFGLPGFV